MVYKMRMNKGRIKCCPYGTYRGNNVVECYYFNIVSLKDCAECTVRKDKNMIGKGE